MEVLSTHRRLRRACIVAITLGGRRHYFLRRLDDAFVTMVSVISFYRLAYLGFKAFSVKFTIVFRAVLCQRKRRMVGHEPWSLYDCGCKYGPKRRENDGYEGCLQVQLRRRASERKKSVFCQFSAGIGNSGRCKESTNQQCGIQPIRRLARKVLHPNPT